MADTEIRLGEKSALRFEVGGDFWEETEESTHILYCG